MDARRSTACTGTLMHPATAGPNDLLSAKPRLRFICAFWLSCATAYGCGDSDQSGRVAPAAERPAAAQQPTMQPTPAGPPAITSTEVVTPLWDASRAPDSFSLTLTDQARGPAVVLRRTCRPDRSFTVDSERLVHAAHEERLTLSVGATSLDLVASPMPEGTGVRAIGPIDTGLLGDIAVGHVIQATYGRQTLGPLRSAARPLLARFVLACRSNAAR